jgi:hypothetical protein
MRRLDAVHAMKPLRVSCCTCDHTLFYLWPHADFPPAETRQLAQEPEPNHIGRYHQRNRGPETSSPRDFAGKIKTKGISIRRWTT